MKISRDGRYISFVDMHNVLGGGRMAEGVLFINKQTGELLLCNEPGVEHWDHLFMLEINSNKELTKALVKTLQTILEKEK